MAKRKVQVTSPKGKKAHISFVQSASASYSTFVDLTPIQGSPCSEAEQNPFTLGELPEFSLNSSMFSTDTQRAKAVCTAHEREEEIRAIRRESQGVQGYLMGRLHTLDKGSSSDQIGLDYYEQELERMKDSIYLKAVQSSSQDGDMTGQLLRMQRELQDMRKTLNEKKEEMHQQQAESLELKQAVRSLERTVIDLGGSLDLGKVTAEAEKKDCAESCSSSCGLF